MSLTPSNMVPLNVIAPDFSLPDGHGKMVCRDEVIMSNGMLVVFMCNHCPYVILLKEALAELGKKFRASEIGMVGINSNDSIQYPDDSPAKMLEDIARYKYSFPYLFDESQQVAKAYDAACTPDFFLFDKALHLVYRGQFDGARPGKNIDVTGKDIYAAAECLLKGLPITTKQEPSVGCNIKWK